MAHANHEALRVIAVYKFIKAAGLVLVALVAFGFLHTPWLDATADWIEHLPIATGHGYLVRWTEALTDFSARKFLVIGIAASAYATLFAVEGWGLWTGKRWAEYLTIVATASLIPLELWEMWRRPTTLKAIAVVVNVAIVVYLWRLVQRNRHAQTAK
jgi:uncharacterized membrane protein (DUF2068 family)